MYARMWLAFVLIWALVRGESIASAQERSATGGRDHRGLFVRASAGLGYSVMGALTDRRGLSVGGLSAQWNLALGGSVLPRLAVHAVYFGSSAFVARARIDGRQVHDEQFDKVATIHTWGAGVTYYNEHNWYLGGQLGVALGVVTDFDTGHPHTTGAGFGIGGILAKEWFVARELGIGVGGQLNVTVLADHGDPWTGISFGPLFSLTLN